jgi:hypothetical protein
MAPVLKDESIEQHSVRLTLAWAWSRGWLYLGVLLAASIVLALYLLRVNRRDGVCSWGMNDSAPGDLTGIDSLTALVTCGNGQRDFSLLTERADVHVQEQFDVSSQSRATFQTGWILELEVPQPVTLGTTVMRYDLHLAIGHILMGRGIAICLERRLALRSRKTGGQQRQRMRFLCVKDIDAHGQVHRKTRTDSLAQTSQGKTDLGAMIRVQKAIDAGCDLVKDRICGLEG